MIHRYIAVYGRAQVSRFLSGLALPINRNTRHPAADARPGNIAGVAASGVPARKKDRRVRWIALVSVAIWPILSQPFCLKMSRHYLQIFGSAKIVGAIWKG